jgi:hypothetical protein
MSALWYDLHRVLQAMLFRWISFPANQQWECSVLGRRMYFVLFRLLGGLGIQPRVPLEDSVTWQYDR